MKKVVNIIFYLVIVILCAFYFFILYIGLFKPNVCIEYKLYYIDKVLKDWPGYGGLNYDGEKLIFDSENFGKQNLRSDYNWECNNNEIWIKDKEAALFFSNVKENSFKINAEIINMENVGSIQVLYDEKVIGEIDELAAKDNCNINIPCTINNKDILKISFRINKNEKDKESAAQLYSLQLKGENNEI